MRSSASFFVVTGALLLFGGLAACSDDGDSNSGGSAGSATGGTGGTGGGETGGTGGGETGGTGGGETGGTGGGETGGTGGGETGGTGGGTGLDCAGACANIVSANCADSDDEATCIAKCSDEMEWHLTECGTEASAYVSCIATETITCDEKGEATAEACFDEEKAHALCAACLPETGDDTCEACIKTECCAELKAMMEDYNTATENAYMDCNEDHCVDDCGSG
jgi:hypothetical protein